MNKLFPGDGVTFHKTDVYGAVLKKWGRKELDMKAKVVCETCNNGWMSRLENDFAKPAMTDLILGNKVGALSNKRARGLSLFAFKTAVIANCSLPKTEHFFTNSERYAFRESLSIPHGVMMWLVGMEEVDGGGIRSHNVHYRNQKDADISLNVCSFWIGQLGFQVVSAKSVESGQLESLPTPPDLTICFYPTLEQHIRWPRERVLRVGEFDEFGNRWNATRRLS